MVRSGLSLQSFLNSVYFFFAAGLALADFAGFLASVFFGAAAASFFAAISVAPLGKTSGTVCPETVVSLWHPESRGDSKVRHPNKGSELPNSS